MPSRSQHPDPSPLIRLHGECLIEYISLRRLSRLALGAYRSMKLRKLAVAPDFRSPSDSMPMTRDAKEAEKETVLLPGGHLHPETGTVNFVPVRLRKPRVATNRVIEIGRDSQASAIVTTRCVI